MAQRTVRWSSVAVTLVVAALAGCVHEIPPPVIIAAPAAASSEQLGWAVEAALAARNWTVQERAPGTISAYVVSQSTAEHAVIEISYRPGTIDIRCVQQEVSRSRYDRWIQLLSSEIQKNAAQIGMGMGMSRPVPTPAPGAP